MEILSKGDRLLRSMAQRSTIEMRWFLANETDDPLRYAFDSKRVVHPRVMGRIVSSETMMERWDQFMKHPNPRLMRAAYVHIPFCQTRCLYCGFFQNYSNPDLEDSYVERLISELRMCSDLPFIQSTPFQAVYIGGGTPSVLSPQNIKNLLRAIRLCLPLSNDYEMTFEARFYGFDDAKVEACLEGGVTRFSLGLQSFDTNVRQSVGRVDDRERVLERLRYLHGMGKAPIIVDLMYGLPNQSMEIWREDVRWFGESSFVDGGDLYQLNVYEDSQLKKKMAQGALAPCANLPTQAEMFQAGVEILTALRLRRLSICHWGKDTRERNLYNQLSKAEKTTIPFGAGAGGVIEGHTFFLERDIRSYMRRIDQGQKPLMFMSEPPKNHELYGTIISQMDKGFLHLRGIRDKFGIDLEERCSPLFDVWQEKKLIEKRGDFLDLTLAGQFWYVNLTQAVLDWLVLTEREEESAPGRLVMARG